MKLTTAQTDALMGWLNLWERPDPEPAWQWEWLSLCFEEAAEAAGAEVMAAAA